MTDNLVERLREWADEPIGDYMDHVERADTLMRKAASELSHLQEALAAAEAGGWQPIETAPKDGGQIFIGIGARMIIARWMADDFYSSVDGGTISVGPNTLWHAFPAPPSRLLNKEDRNG